MNLLTKVSAFLAVLLGMPALSLAVSYNAANSPYTQNFDGLPTTGSVTITGRGPHAIEGQLGTTGLDGWTMSNHAGSSTNTEFRAQDGSTGGSGGRGVISFGTTGSNERALGLQLTSNQISRFGVEFTNNSGMVLNDFTVSFTGEQWRRGEPGVQNSMFFAWDVTSLPGDGINGPGIFSGVAGLSFDNPNNQVAPQEVALNGNDPLNQVALSHRVKGINWAPGQRLLLRWTGTEAQGQDNGMGIDNFSFRAHVPEPASWIFAMVAAVSLAFRRRRS
jgi:hypothetical protein